ncbi:uncharacterized protein F4812DRAFT_424972 [Daldinia caldariorum]|uniref:uncharacterized protein n=1 Tax=Daldinia caldariorum TaxID=326644 RepID=UPI002007327F|nr:uncharacterized protein F4812DRAFT_424972 [Daldinia caldariorum]KAI1468872.1 hypothetical protein F4812DRAFT_424972 [Daldinia caldariorum]
MPTYEGFAILRRFMRLNYQSLLYVTSLSASRNHPSRRKLRQDCGAGHCQPWANRAPTLEIGGGWLMGKRRAARAQWRQIRCVRKKPKEHSKTAYLCLRESEGKKKKGVVP